MQDWLRQIQADTEACRCVLEIPLRDGYGFARQSLCKHYTTIFAAALAVAPLQQQEVEMGERQCYPAVLLIMVLYWIHETSII